MKIKKLLGAILTGVVGGVLALAIYSLFIKPETKIITVNDRSAIQLANLNSNPTATGNVDFVIAAEKSVNAVVHVKTKYEQDNYSESIYDFFFGNTNRPSPPVVTSSGSGVIVSSNGYIVTNNHVIDGSDYIEVVLNDKRSFKATLVGTDQKTDIALLKIEEENLPYLSYGDSHGLKIGEWVLAVGFEFKFAS